MLNQRSWDSATFGGLTPTLNPKPLTPINPINPTNPINPINPIDPINPINPIDPINPEPLNPSMTHLARRTSLFGLFVLSRLGGGSAFMFDKYLDLQSLFLGFRV